MKLHQVSNICLVIVIIFSFIPASGQNTSIGKKPESLYRSGIELFNKEKFGAAQQKFEEVIREVKDNKSEIKTNAEYYKAICACELSNGDAEYLLNQFIINHPESSKINRIFFRLGKLQFAEKDFRNAITSFDQVNMGSLSAEEINELYFKKAYCLLQSKKNEEAKKHFEWLKNSHGQNSYKNAAIYYYAHILYEEGYYNEAYNEFASIQGDKNFEEWIPFYLIQISYYTNDFQTIIENGPQLLAKAEEKRKGEIARLIGDAYYRNNDFLNAELYLENYSNSKRVTISREDHYQMGMTYYRNNKYEKAVQHFQNVIEGKDSLSQNAYYHLADCYLKTDRKKHASNAFLMAYRVGENEQIREDALFNYAKLSVEITQGPYNEPIKTLEQYISEYPESVRIDEANNLLVQLFLTTKNYQAAINTFGKIKNPTEKLREAYQKITYFRAIELFNNKQYREAIQLFETASSYTYDRVIRTESKFWTGEAYYNLGDNRTAMKYFNEFRRSPYARQTSVFNNSNYNLGYLYFNNKKYNDAINYFTEFYDNAGDENLRLVNDALLRLGDCYFINKNYTIAGQYYEKALSTGYNADIDYALYKNAMCYNDYNNYNKKINILEDLVEKYPNSPYIDKALYEIASTEEALGNKRRAITFYQKILNEHPRSTLRRYVLLKLGLIYYSNDQFQQSIDILKQVAEDYPNTKEAKSAIASLENIYVEMNKVEEYLEFTKDNPDSDITLSAQDSLLFVAAETQYMRNDCKNSLPSLYKYLERFPEGHFSSTAHYYIADCELRNNNHYIALDHFDYVINKGKSDFTENALLNAALLSDQLNLPDSAYRYYALLEQYAENNTNKNIALEGQMINAFETQRYIEAIESAKKLLKNSKVTNSQTIQGHYVLAKSFMALNQPGEANKEFKITANLAKNETGAESTYYQALIAYNTNDLKLSEELIFNIIENFASYNYWVARSFILLSDVYVKQNLFFEAKETLNSIIENYPGDDLKGIANEKLSAIKLLEEVRNATPEREDY